MRGTLGRTARRLVVAVVGLLLVLAGVVMLVLPGPGIATILAGLAVLASEFTWARRVLRWARTKFDNVRHDLRYRRDRRARRAGGDPAAEG